MVTETQRLADHDEVAGLFRALGDPTRLAIVDQLRDGPRAVGVIAGRFEISRPAVSKHLRVLREARLVAEEAVGRERIYRLAPMALRRVDVWLERYRLYWTARLLDLKAFVENEERPGRERLKARHSKAGRP